MLAEDDVVDAVLTVDPVSSHPALASAALSQLSSAGFVHIYFSISACISADLSCVTESAIS
ncbi:MAG: hypothetical protein ACD_65C00050G0001 [uncultured bacterium]|nr:MAG: hypothetical protein ACD_65C00050G0001 [uncultured bacterium]